MRMALTLLIFVGLGFANFGTADFIDCDKSCCTSNGGEWDWEYEYCDIDTSSSGYEDYEACYEQCLEDAYGDAFADGACCCAPAFMLLTLLGCALKR